MSLPAHHLLPSSAFRHIGIMVFFMYYIAAFSLLGFISVNDITKGWLKGLEHTLDIEIPAYDLEAKSVFNTRQMDQDLTKIQDYLKGDPLVEDINLTRTQPIETDLEGFDIPAPYFLTILLSKDRADNAEDRLISNMRRRVPHVIIHEPELWQADIHRTALTFQIIFSGLAASIFIVTGIILSAVIRTQLKAHEETVRLIHLMGAAVKTIAKLFKTSVTRAVFWGVFLSGGLAGISLSMLTFMLGLEEHLRLFLISLGIIAFIFIALCRLITHLTVLASLRKIP